MPSTLLQKLKIKEGYSLLTLNAPKEFKSTLGELPGGAKISTQARNPNQIHWFVKDRNQLENELDDVLKFVKDDVVCWIYYPKGTSKIQTDLTRDKGWDKLLAHEELQWVSLISFDETWSTFAFRLKTETDKKKEETKKPREIWNYVDPQKKSVKVPEDLEKLLKKNKRANEFFQALSFTNKKEYIEWIVTAKREETRNDRVNGTIERLEKGWKNPRNI